MPNLDLSALNGAELRRLLDSSRERGLATQSYQILEEMARRREAGPQRRSRRPAEPRVISMEFGDPLERGDDFADAEPDPQPDPAGELTLGRAPRESRRRWGLPAGTFVAGAAMGVALGAWLASGGGERPSSSAELAALQAEVAAPTPLDTPAPPAAEPPPVAEASIAPSPAPDMAETPAEPTPEAPEAAAQAEPAPAAAEEPAQAATASDDGCLAAAQTPADRTICADPDLQRLQRDLRRAYAEAIDAHADRTILRQRQLAWRDARNTVTDPARLAALYQERIRKLNAATEDARRQR